MSQNGTDLFHHGRTLDLIDNLSSIFIPVPGNIVLSESNALLLQCICYDTDKLPDGMPA